MMDKMGEMMSGMMSGMMEHMGGSPPKELYPSLMELPELTPEKRSEIQSKANDRMAAGTALLSQGLDRLSAATPIDNFIEMQQATAQMREGLAQFESGIAANRALTEGKAPQSVALDWFKREMNLTPLPGSRHPTGFFGVSGFHLAVMTALVLFAVLMVWMYFHKMSRATALLQKLAVPTVAGGGVPAATGIISAARPARTPQSPDARQELAVEEPPISSPAADPATCDTRPGPQVKWTGKLLVRRIFQETPDVKTFRLINPDGGSLPFTYLPGQFANLKIPLNGKTVRRSYTIASSPTHCDYLELTVKREPQGLVSCYLNDVVKEGQFLEIEAPLGKFTFTGREAESVVLIGGGVGITPLMSAIRYLTDRGWPGEIFLLFSCRTPDEMIFGDELNYLHDRNPNFHLFVTMTRAEGLPWAGARGRISKELLNQSVPNIAARRVHICGPSAMIKELRQAAVELGLPPDQIKIEAFGPDKKETVSVVGAAAPAAPPAGEPTPQIPRTATATVTFAVSGKSALLPADTPILDVADEIGVDIENSCRVGTCGTCKVKLLTGNVTMEVEEGLDPGDKEKGLILACQAKSTGDVAVEA